MVDFMRCLGRRNKRSVDRESRSKSEERDRTSIVTDRNEGEAEEASVAAAMLVSADGALLKPGHGLGHSDQSGLSNLRLAVATVDGVVWEVSVDPDLTVDKLKQTALGHFRNPAETIKAAARYKLVTARPPEKQLTDEFTLMQEGVKNGDELILLKKSVSKQPANVTQESRDVVCKAPDEATIKQSTLHVPVKNADRVAKDTVTVVDFQVELRKTLVSLIDVAQKIQLYNKNSKNLLTYIVPSEDDDNGGGGDGGGSCGAGEGFSKDLVDPSALKQLTDMGFSASKAKKALQQKQMSAVDALEQLLQQQGQPECDGGGGGCDDNNGVHPVAGGSSETSDEQSPLTESATDGTTTSTSSSSEDSSDEVHSSPPPPPPPPPQMTSATLQSTNRLISLQQLLDVFRAYKRREFRPNMKAFYNLRDMGFDQDKIVDALRVSGNKHDAAFEWLLSRWLTDDDLRLGLDVDGSVYKAIIDNPVIQLGLNNPKVLYAFLHMLENPNCTHHWLNDPDLAPILNQIFKIYHLEKYSLQIKPGTVPST